jgi:hypothetical protein
MYIYRLYTNFHKLFFIGIICLQVIAYDSFAQSKKVFKAAPNFMGAAGNTALANNITYMWSVGETVVFTGNTATNYYTQGFQQPMVCKATPIITAYNKTSCLLPYTLSVTSSFNVYYWKLGNSSIVNSNDYTYNPVTNGNYKVIVGDSTGCVLTSSIESVDLSTKNLIPSVAVFGNGVKDTLLQSSTATSYQWYAITPTDGVHRAIVGATNSAYKPLYNGTYYVKINTDENCVSYSSYTVINNTSWDLISRYITILSDSTMLINPILNYYKAFIYPVPAFDKVNIDYQTPSKNLVTLAIYDIKGVLVDTKKLSVSNGNVNYVFNKNELASGNYVLSLTDGDHKEVHGLIFE